MENYRKQRALRVIRANMLEATCYILPIFMAAAMFLVTGMTLIASWVMKTPVATLWGIQ